MDLNEKDLQNVLGGLSYEDAVEKQSDFFKRTAPSTSELSEEELQSVTAGIPRMPDMDTQLPDGAHINEFGEIEWEEPHMRR